MASDRERAGRASLLRRLALGGVLACFGAWELTAPSQWAGYVPPAVAAHLPAIPAVLAHGWVLLMVGAALLLDYLTPAVAWVAVAIMVEVVGGLVWTSGFSTTLVRDLGLLALAVGVAVDCGVAARPDRNDASAGRGRTNASRTAAPVRGQRAHA